MGKDRYDRVNESFIVTLRMRLKFAKILFVKFSDKMRIRTKNSREKSSRTWCMQLGNILVRKIGEDIFISTLFWSDGQKISNYAGFRSYGDAVVITTLFSPLLYGYTEVE